MELKVGIDLRCLPADGSPGAGVAHAAREITRALLSFSGDDIAWTMFLPKSIGTSDDPRVVALDTKDGRALRRALIAHPCDFLFVPSGAVALGLPVPAIPWVHDVAIYDHPEWFPESFLRRSITTRLFARGLRVAPQILAVSQSTRQEIIKRFDVDPKKIHVTWEGGDTILASLQGKSLRDAKRRAKHRLAMRGLKHPYILVLGTLEPRKNIPMLLEAWLHARPRFNKSVHLLIAGRDGWKMRPIQDALEHTRLVTTRGASKLHRAPILSDEERRDALLAAEIVVVPSLYEGFGLVACEAMQAETAVLASNAGALPEVFQKGGMTLPPHDHRLWSEALIHLINDDQERSRIAKQGKAQSQEMTWEKSATTVLNVLTKLHASRIVSTSGKRIISSRDRAVGSSPGP